MFLDDEQLAPRAEIVGGRNLSKLVIRPLLFICGVPAPLSLLENVVLIVKTSYPFSLLSLLSTVSFLKLKLNYVGLKMECSRRRK